MTKAETIELEWNDWAPEQRGPRGPWWQTASHDGRVYMRVSMDQGKTWQIVSGCRMPEWA
jgi:hypothetical protein